MNAYFGAIQRYFDFSGRSTRSEFWLFILFQFLISLALVVLDQVLFRVPITSEDYGPLTIIGTLFHIIPTLSVAARRLHDTDKTGWWQLIGIIPIVGWIVLLVFVCTGSTPGENRFGPDPFGRRGYGARSFPVARGGSSFPEPSVDAYQPAPASASVAPKGDTIAELERLNSLRQSGAIDDNEFAQMKSRILGAQA